MGANTPSNTVTEYGAFTPGLETQLETVFLLKESGGASQTVSTPVTFANAATFSSSITNNGNETQAAGTFALGSAGNGLILAGNSGNAQNYANGLQLGNMINQIVTANANNNSCILPPSANGMAIIVANFNTAVTIVVFPTKNEAINFSANNAGYSLATNNFTQMYCPVKGTWIASQAAIA